MLAPSGSIAKAGPTAQWRGAGKAFGDKVQWVIHGGVPRAAVIRTWRHPDNEEREIQEFSVFAIDGRKAFAYAAIAIHVAQANGAALASAEAAAGSGRPKSSD
jgi:hypothetical protein